MCNNRQALTNPTGHTYCIILLVRGRQLETRLSVNLLIVTDSALINILISQHLYFWGSETFNISIRQLVVPGPFKIIMRSK